MKIKWLIVITVLVPVVFLIIGTLLAALSFNNCTIANFFTSIPIISNQSSFSIEYPINTNIDSDIFTFSMKVEDKKIKKKDAFIMHNMYGYQINASLIINDEKIDTINISRNNNLSNSVEIKRYPIVKFKKYKSALKKIQITNNVFNVFCPFSTEITRIKEVDSYCRYDLIPMLFDGKYSLTRFFSKLKTNFNGQITIQFNSSFFIPCNYIETPEAYIIFIGYSNKDAMFYSGVVILIIGGILSVSLTINLIVKACIR